MGKTILTVDDSVTMRQAIAMTLEKEGYEVIQAVDGVDALSKLNGKKVHAIVTDVHMPNMDGITLVSEIRKLPEYKFTPIVVVTTEAQADRKEAGRTAGATGWIIKPFKPDQLVSVMKKVCP